jgi:hypothetical protein
MLFKKVNAKITDAKANQPALDEFNKRTGINNKIAKIHRHLQNHFFEKKLTIKQKGK